MITRREILKSAMLTAAGIAAGAYTPRLARAADPAPAAAPAPAGPFLLPPLPYAYDALEPHIDAKTMQIHHDKHHAAYVANLNKAVADHPDLASKSVEELLKDLSAVPESIRTAVRNNGGGHANHTMFWETLKVGGPAAPSGALGDAIKAKFGSYENFQAAFTKEALGVFGSGWAWLSNGPDGLILEHLPNQDTPLSSGRTPLLGLDVWEHAYYLKYQNKRPDYVAAFYNIIDWSAVGARFDKSKTV
ncbi:superoxide dismutase [Mn] [Capsulimonas corticalis]|uniref:Superoxide dismutase n=1 Tax=Capsulimonas corticalis TaxID=2219043 RepID=A0A402CV25_9BACT|nr:superoxide dismutase [Capsulimonas corticalis]BDI30281.1 superoxide dismutase [Mn] [Capsulimonas corticalis]